MRAVVHEDVGANQEPGGGYRQCQHEQVRDRHREVHQDPAPGEGDHGGGEGEEAPTQVGAGIEILACLPRGAYLGQRAPAVGRAWSAKRITGVTRRTRARVEAYRDSITANDRRPGFST